jgi:hypothetical protein
VGAAGVVAAGTDGALVGVAGAEVAVDANGVAVAGGVGAAVGVGVAGLGVGVAVAAGKLSGFARYWAGTQPTFP